MTSSWHFEHCCLRHATEKSPSSTTSLELNIQMWTPAKCNDENYQHIIQQGFFLTCLMINKYYCNTKFIDIRDRRKSEQVHEITLGSLQASRCARRMDRILAINNPGLSLCPSYENGGRVVPPGTITVLLQDIPGEKGSLSIRYPDLIKPMYWISFVGI